MDRKKARCSRDKLCVLSLTCSSSSNSSKPVFNTDFQVSVFLCCAHLQRIPLSAKMGTGGEARLQT